MAQAFDGKKTQANIDKFVLIIKKSFAQYLNEVLNERLKKITEDAPEETVAAQEEPEPEVEDNEPQVNTTQEEVEMFFTIRALLHNLVDTSRISYKDTRSYFNILLDNKTKHWICRLFIEGKVKSVIFHYEGAETEKVVLKSLSDIYQYQDNLERAVKAQEKPFA
ncbi:MAG: hypothetical protein IJM73_02445 [Spirochaetales bacterium]|nr:hypothetical protein [Spirochaetales bacterium]